MVTPAPQGTQQVSAKAMRAQLWAVADELDRGLCGAKVQKISQSDPRQLYLELRQQGRSILLWLSVAPGAERLAVVETRPLAPKNPFGLQQRLRKLISDQRLVSVTHEALELCLRFETAQLRLLLDVHRFEVTPVQHGEQEVRRPTPSDFPLARAMGSHAPPAPDRSRELIRHLKRLERTRLKVAEEAARGPLAEQYRRDGELLSRHLADVERGATRVTLVEYTPEGPQPRELALDPKRSPKQQVDWFFHQYRRLQRGAAVAAQRLQKIDAEIAAARLPDPPPWPDVSARRPKPAPAQPFREYRSATGQVIWVGRGAAQNDALTFRVAQPHHLWLHARGLTGAHVVVPLQKKQTIDSETLIDAAHLAFHFSDGRGERAGEVSYTPVRYLRKAAAVGAVTYSRETTFWLKVEPERLARLLGV